MCIRDRVAYFGVVAKGFGNVSETVDVPRTKHEGAPELERVLFDALLAEAGLFRFLASFPVVFAEQVEEVGLFEVHGLVGLALFVDQEREGDASLLDEGTGED